MRHWKTLTSPTGPVLFASLIAAMTIMVAGCKKSEPVPAETIADTAVVLPEPPGLDSLEDAFAEDDLEPAVEPAPQPRKTAPAKPADPRQGIVENGAYTLQIGIFKSEAVARKRADALKAQGYPAYVSHVRDPKPEMPGLYYRVRIGSFATTVAARHYGAANLAPAGIDYWADLKGRDTQPVVPVYKPRPAAPVPAPAPAPAPQAPPAPAAASESSVPAPAAPPAPEPPPAAAPAPASPPAPAEEAPPALPDW